MEGKGRIARRNRLRFFPLVLSVSKHSECFSATERRSRPDAADGATFFEHQDP
jgi:hypothetical protein